jgi:hypothetical protein
MTYSNGELMEISMMSRINGFQQVPCYFIGSCDIDLCMYPIKVVKTLSLSIAWNIHPPDLNP